MTVIEQEYPKLLINLWSAVQRIISSPTLSFKRIDLSSISKIVSLSIVIPEDELKAVDI